MQRSGNGRVRWLSNALGSRLASASAASFSAASGVKGGNLPFGGSTMSDVRRVDRPLGTGVRNQISLS